MKPKRRLTQIFSLMLSGVSLVSILLIGALWISFETNRSSEEISKIRGDYIADYESTINLETNRICDYMEAQRQSGEIQFLRSIKERVYEAFDLIGAIDRTPLLEIKPSDLEKIILSGLGGLSFNQGRGRYFVSTASGRELLSSGRAPDGSLDGPPTGSNYQSPAAFVEISRSLAQIKEGFFRYNLARESRGSGEDSDSQVAYLKVYEPFNWVIGTSEYLDEWARGIQTELLDWAGSMALPADTYLMIINYNGDILHHPDGREDILNVFADSGDPAEQKMAAQLIRGAKDHNKDFIRYSFTDPETGETIERIGYYRAIPAWNWVVVTWIYSRNIETAMAEQQATLASNVRSQITNIVIISISMLAVIMLLSKVLSALATRSFAAFFRFFENASTSSIEINPGEQPFEEFARLAQAANNMINQRKLANNLLQESELRFKTIFNVSPQVITISDLSGVLLDANDEFRKFSRLDPSRAVGRLLEESFVLSSEARESLWAELKKDGALVGRETETTSLDGSPLTFLVFGKMIHMQVGSFILVIFTDITALKAAENEKLVLQEKLSRSTKMEAMGLMAAEVAHDLNNILSGIIGYPQLLLMEPNITDKQKDSLKEILETGQRAAAVVSDLLTIARGVASIKASLPVNNVVSDYAGSPECRQLQDIFPNVRLALNLDPQAGNIVASTVHLTKVVMNLVSNAFEAMPADRTDGVVAISTAMVDLRQPPAGNDGVFEPGRYALIRVSDNGPGIPREDVAKIFEPFYSKKAKGRSGTGLGLAIVWNTISDHNGYLDVETGPTGTTFKLYFRSTEEKTSVKERKKIDDYKGAGQRILVVDDVDIQRKLASKMLAALGYDPVAVPSGEAAVEFLKREDVDLVILDMIMHPGMNGRETYGAIMEFKPRQKAIIASGMAETDEVAKAQAMGAGQFVNKPYTIEDLAAAVRKALDG
ncbi:MAG: cache domain-containing protein [Candidatus Adiutrix sp.]|nr:cache domain-containing protein [Candidatus Adiutrix sp.]